MIRSVLAGAALLLASGLAAATGSPWPYLDASVSLDPSARRLAAEGTLALPPGEAMTLRLAARFRDARAVLADGAVLVPAVTGDDVRWRIPAATTARVVRLHWQGTLDPPDTSLGHRETLTHAAPVAGPGGTFLPSASGWHPAIDGQPLSYRIALSLPADQRGLVAGRLDSESVSDEGYRAAFAFDAPGEGIDLMAGPYRITESATTSIDGRPLRLRTYFTAGLDDLANGYLEATVAALGRFERDIGPYPYDGFSIVASPTPTGFGMPTLTYLGADVLKLPFLRETSLVHEILHNWWGNGVHPDTRQGNWSEGLTTLMADYDGRARQGAEAGQAMRLAWLRDVTALPPEADRPLSAFTSRTHEASHILGYQKTAMVLFMLRDRLGADLFQSGLRRFWREFQFRTASWDDLRRALETESAQALGPFFDRWIRRAGVPALRLAAAFARPGTEGWTVEVTVRTDLPDAVTPVSVVVDTVAGSTTFPLVARTTETRGVWRVPARPLQVRLDPEMRTLRRLDPDEAPPILRDAMVRRDLKLVILDDTVEYRKAAAELASRLLDPQPALQDPGIPPASPVLVVGPPERIALYASRFGLGNRPEALRGKGGAGAWVSRTVRGPSVFVEAPDAETARGWMRPMPHYGSQSWLRFDGRRVADRGVAPATPQRIELSRDTRDR